MGVQSEIRRARPAEKSTTVGSPARTRRNCRGEKKTISVRLAHLFNFGVLCALWMWGCGAGKTREMGGSVRKTRLEKRREDERGKRKEGDESPELQHVVPV